MTPSVASRQRQEIFERVRRQGAGSPARRFIATAPPNESHDLASRSPLQPGEEGRTSDARYAASTVRGSAGRSDVASIPFVDVDLDGVQTEAFMEIVEAFRSAHRGKRTLLLSESLAGARLHGPGGQTWTNLDRHDLDVMVDYGLLTVSYGTRGTPNYAVTPGGNRYYEWLRKHQGLPVKQVETAIRDFVEAEWFSERFGAAHARWSEAVELLCPRTPSVSSPGSVTPSGKPCRNSPTNSPATSR